MKKGIKYFFGVILAIVVVYNTVYFRPLDEKLLENNELVFDANAYVNEIWGGKLYQAYDSAVDFTALLNQLQHEPKIAFSEHANALAIGNIGFFRIKGEGIVLKVNPNDVLLDINKQTVKIETEFIFGNAICDASGLIKISDFDKTSDLNSISESINNKIRKEIIPKFRSDVEVGNKVAFKGAMELNQAHLDLSLPEIIPISIQIVP